MNPKTCMKNKCLLFQNGCGYPKKTLDEIWQEKDKSIYYIPCIGIDNKQHICYPWEDNCYCGVEVLRKKLLRDDWELFSCYECTF